VTATGLTDVCPRYAQPFEPGRVGKHLPEQLAVAGLEPLSLPERPARIRDPRRERVPHRLQLAQTENPRLTRPSGDRGVQSHPRKRLGEQPGEPALEAADLASQLGSGEALVATDDKLGPSVSLQQIGHDRFRV
jgi:hypothetical protein